MRGYREYFTFTVNDYKIMASTLLMETFKKRLRGLGPGLLFILAVSGIGLYIQSVIEAWSNHNVYKWDVAGYYAYLPAAFIHEDLDSFTCMMEYGRQHGSFGTVENYGLIYHEQTQRYSNKYPIGVALMQMPFFFIAHGIASLHSAYPADGFSMPYQMGTVFSNFGYVVLGLLLLYSLLCRYVSSWISVLTLILIAFGTNLYYYGIFFTGMSHSYLFFLYALCLWSSMKFHESPSRLFAILIGLSLGLAVVCRPTDVLLALFPLFWPLSVQDESRWTFMKKHAGKYLLALCVFLIPVSLQMLYWQYSTGSLISYSYGNEGFVFSDPAIWRGLFSFQKGWFIYTPLALLGFIGAVYWLWKAGGLWKKSRSYLWAFFIYYGLSFYILFSWWMWFYGGSFGCRVLVQSYAILALPMSLILERIYTSQLKKAWKMLISVVFAWFIFLNVFQSYQYHRGFLHWDRMSRAYYFATFLDLNITEDDRKLLKSHEEMYHDLEKRKK